MTERNKITRTSAGLRDALFDAMERLSSGDLDGEQAAAMAKVAKEICNTVRLEVEVTKLRSDFPADTPLVIPAPLQLGVPEDDKPKLPAVRKVLS